MAVSPNGHRIKNDSAGKVHCALLQQQQSRHVFWMCLLLFSVRTPAVLIDVFHDFALSLKQNVSLVLQLRHYLIFSNALKFITDLSPYNSTIYRLPSDRAVRYPTK